jgi:uncharacterized protein (TIGR02996 family)
MRTFVFTDGSSNKFWHIELTGKSFTVQFGRVGTSGQTQTKSFASPTLAQNAHDKLVAEKLKKGYVETTPAAAPPAAPVPPKPRVESAPAAGAGAEPPRAAADPNTRTFEFIEAGSNKFWHIRLTGNQFTVRYGRTGTSGQTQTKTFATPFLARTEHDKLVAEKLKKGYVETTPAAARPGAAPASPEQLALEKALVAHPDELAAHSAYADYLTEAGDPRGEFIQVQLALEDESRTKAERNTLRKRESALLAKHAREWMGDLGRMLVGTWSGEDKPYRYRFARGWLDFLCVLPGPQALIEALARVQEARMLRRLEIVYDMRYHFDQFEPFLKGVVSGLTDTEKHGWEDLDISQGNSILPALAAAPFLPNLRALKIGFSDDHPNGPSFSTCISAFETMPAADLLGLLKACPRLDELSLNTYVSDTNTFFGSSRLGNLRILQSYYGDTGVLDAVAKNKALANLTTLRIQPGRDDAITLDSLRKFVRSKHLPRLEHLQLRHCAAGDEGAEEIVGSGILKRLKTLDFADGTMTDAGATVLAACPDLSNLELLDVRRNGLTPAGVRALKRACAGLVADEQQDPNDISMRNVDWE